MSVNIMECTNFTDNDGKMSQHQIATGNGVYYLVDLGDRSSQGYPSVITELTGDLVSAMATLVTEFQKLMLKEYGIQYVR